jgi:hypothetical protein
VRAGLSRALATGLSALLVMISPISRFARITLALPVSVVLLCAVPRGLVAQADVVRREATPIRAWGFVRLGAAASDPVAVATSGAGVLTSASAGIAASDGVVLAMVKASDSFQLLYGPEIRDWAFLAGARSRGDRFVVAGAAGAAFTRPFENGDEGNGGPVGSQQRALAYDLSAHWDYRVAGISFSISGVTGRPKRSYVAALIGIEAGWFGR